MEKIKVWVVYDDEFPKGLVFEEREWALDYSREIRSEGEKAYTRVKYFTPDELEALPETD